MIGKVAAALAVVLVMVLGVLGLGRLAASDLQAMVMTSAFFLVLAVGIGLVVRRRREWADSLGCEDEGRTASDRSMLSVCHLCQSAKTVDVREAIARCRIQHQIE